MAVAMTALVLTPASSFAGPIIDVTGSTLGCFGSGCAPGATATVGSHGLTFTSTGFDVDTDATGSVMDFSLGTIGRANVNVPTSTPDVPFTLQVTFTVPSTITGGQAHTFTATVMAGNGPGAPVEVDFDFDNTWQTFNYTNASGTGSFDFSVLYDLDVEKNSLTNPVHIRGGIRNASFTPTSTQDPPTQTTPEPTTLLLLGTGLVTLAARRRRAS